LEVNSASSQLTLSSTPGFDEPILIVDDYGRRGDGLSNAHTILAANGNEYVIKGPSLSQDNLFVGVNEFIGVQMARAIGLPVLEHELFQNGAELFFGTLNQRSTDFYKELTPDLFARCYNKDVVYSMLIFDLWICNNDRHEENIITRRSGAGTSAEKLFIIPFDHGNALLYHRKPASLQDLDMPLADCIILDFLAEYMDDSIKLRRAVDIVCQIPRTHIRSVVQSVPEAWLKRREKVNVEEFLVDRQGKLVERVNEGLAKLPKLGSVTL